MDIVSAEMPDINNVAWVWHCNKYRSVEESLHFHIYLQSNNEFLYGN